MGNVARLLEAHGAVVARLSGRAARVDAFSQWMEGRPFVILWRNKSDGTNLIWTMRGATQTGTLAVPAQPDLNWRLVDSADFNGDGWLDLVWHNRATGGVQLWYGPTFTTTAPSR